MIRSTVQYFPFMSANTVTALFLSLSLTDLFYCRFSGIIWSEVIPQSPVSAAAAALEMSLMEWEWAQ